MRVHSGKKFISYLIYWFSNCDIHIHCILFPVHNLNWYITFPLSKFHLTWHTNQTTDNSKMLFLNKSICNFILQVIRNFTVEYDHEMKFKHTFLRMPTTPLNFRMMDRESWRSPKNFSTVTMTEFKYAMWFDIFASKMEIKNSDINCNRFSEN